VEKGLLDAAIGLIQTVGFPIVVCGWFMFRMEKRIDAQTEVLNQIARLLAKLTEQEAHSEP
jgi:hypothetical protein